MSKVETAVTINKNIDHELRCGISYYDLFNSIKQQSHYVETMTAMADKNQCCIGKDSDGNVRQCENFKNNDTTRCSCYYCCNDKHNKNKDNTTIDEWDILHRDHSYYQLESNYFNNNKRNNSTSKERQQLHRNDIDKETQVIEEDGRCRRTLLRSESVSSTSSSKSSFTYWVDDEWTKDDEMYAEQLLHESATICRINNETLQKEQKQLRRRHQRTKKMKHNSTGIIKMQKKKMNNNENDDNEEAWNFFYIHNSNNFFKDRHYLSVTFPNEFGNNSTNRTIEKNMCRQPNNDNDCTTTDTFSSSRCNEYDDSSQYTTTLHCHRRRRRLRCVVEVGCGVGNTLLPLLENHHERRWKTWDRVYGLDLSPVAIDILRKDERFQNANLLSKNRNIVAGEPVAIAEVCDISIPNSIPLSFRGVATVSTLLFCLSAIDPSNHIIAAQNAVSTLALETKRKYHSSSQQKQNETQELRERHVVVDEEDEGEGEDDESQLGGVLVFRDYGRYDEAQLKLACKRNKLLPVQISGGATAAARSGTSSMSESSTSVVQCNERDCDVDDSVNDGDDTTSYSHYYRKHDGTKCYYFTTDDVLSIFAHTLHMEVLECRYIKRMYTNRSTGIIRRRVWVQARFRRCV